MMRAGGVRKNSKPVPNKMTVEQFLENGPRSMEALDGYR